MKKNNGILKWRFDISTFRLIGRDLITDRITALFELVKNCYDANATRVDITFSNVGEINGDSIISIKDNGIGMSFSDIRDKWMVIGTSNKRVLKYSPEPFNRKVVGEKGIGRFAVDKLGSIIEISTTQKYNNDLLTVKFNSDSYNELTSNNNVLKLFTDVENEYDISFSPINDHGTCLNIKQVREEWSINDIRRLYKELAKLISPAYPMNQPFDIFIHSNEYDEFNNKLVESESTKYSTMQFNLKCYNDRKTQDCLKFNKENGCIDIIEREQLPFGGVDITLHYFDASAKKIFHRKYKGDDNRIDGVKIYRDGLITTPFAEFESHTDKKRDILGIDKRRQREIFNKLGTRDVIGVVNITKQNNPNIIDATNRQDFIENKEYSSLKDFIIQQLDEISAYIVYAREIAKKDVMLSLDMSREEISEFIISIDEISQKNPQISADLRELKKKATQVETTVKKGIKEFKKAEQDFIRKENIYLSLMSLQDYAKDIAHAVRTSLSSIKGMAEFFYDRYPNEELEEFFLIYSKSIYIEMSRLKTVIDFMLRYAGSNIGFRDIRIKEFIESIFNQYELNFTSEGIDAIIDIKDDFILNANTQFFADIFQNLISNSIKALENVSDKEIKCTGYIEDDNFIILFSDNGYGIDKDMRNDVFELYYTTTAEEGGAGIGLFIVKTRIESLRGSISVIDSEYINRGATFKILFPFKREK